MTAVRAAPGADGTIADGGPSAVAGGRRPDPAAGEWRDYPRGELMHELFRRQVRLRPDAVAVVAGDGVLSYRGLHRRAEHWAALLRAAGAAPEVTVGVHLNRGPELVAVLLGVLTCGAAYVPLDPQYPAERLEFMAADSDMAVLVSDQPGLALSHPVTVLRPGEGTFPADLAAGGTGLAPRQPADGDPSQAPRRLAGCDAGIAYVLYTSGSTGRPKGVQLTHANAVDLLHWARETFGDELGRVLATTSICFDCSILEIFAPLSWGGTVVLADSALDVANLDVGHDVRLMHTVPSVMAELLRTDRLPPTAGTVLLGGEAPWQQLVRDVYRGASVRRLLNVYGPTEYTSYATMAVISPGDGPGPPPIGRPVANTWVHLLDERGDPVPDGVPGELYIAGRGLARGYLGRPGLTARRFVPDAHSGAVGARAYRSGDLGSRDTGGVLTFLGRVDDQVKVRGVRVEPAEVERVLLQHRGVSEVAVVAPADGPVRRRLVAFVVPAAATAPSPDGLREHAGSQLPPAMVPDSYVLLPRLPRLPNGKVDRTRLVPPPQRDCGRAPFVAPRDELEAQLAAQWADALQVQRVGVHDDFYGLGGQSLAAMRIRGRLSDLLGVDVPVHVMLTARTVAAQAAALRAAPPAPAAPPWTSTNPIGLPREVPLSPNQLAVLARMDRHPLDPTLHLPLCVRLSGPLRPAALDAALTALLARHEVLRCALDKPWPKPRLVLGPAQPLALPLVDLSGLPDSPAREELAREELAERLSAEAATRPFDLGHRPLLHTVLLRLGPHEHVLSVTLHQLAGDVWSMAGAGRQLLALYRHATDASRPDEVLPRVQYPDWARAQLDWLHGPAGAAQRRFWRERLTGLPSLDSPCTGTRVAAAQATAGSHEFAMDGVLLDQVTALAGQESATRYVVLLAAYQLLLGRWAGQEVFAIGCPITGRVHPDLARTIGPFVNAIVLRADLRHEVSPEAVPGTGADLSFRELLCRARDDAWQCYANQDLPFAEAVAELGLDADPTRHPAYQASIVLHYLDQPSRPPHGLSVTDYGRRPQTHTALDLELAVYADDNGAECSLTYRHDVVDADTAAGLASQYLALLREVTADPDRPISTYPVITTWPHPVRAGAE